MKLQHLALIGKYNATPQHPTEDPFTGIFLEIAQYVNSLGCQVSVEEVTAKNLHITQFPIINLDKIGAGVDAALVIGGDGTMLGAGRILAKFGIPLIGINRGRLGFITDIPLARYQPILAAIVDGKYKCDSRNLICARVIRAKKSLIQAHAINDVVVSHGNSSGMLKMRIEVDGHFVANQWADGLIVSTPTGSTAYSLSAGGPILYPGMQGWVIVPIAPHTLTNRPIVIPNSSQITIEIVAGSDPSTSFDNQSFTDLKPGDLVEVSLAKEKIKLLHHQDWSYFDTLREKLHWNEALGS